MKMVHSEYAIWVHRYRWQVLGLGAVTVPILVALDYIAIAGRNDLLLILASVIYIAGMQTFVARLPLRQRQFKREWEKKHGTDNS